MAVALANMGHNVLYVDTVGLRRLSMTSQDLRRVGARLRSGLRPPRRMRETLWVWSPLVLPSHRYGAIRAVNRIFLHQMLSWVLRLLRFRPQVVWTYHPLTTRLWKTEGLGKLVYHCVDEVKAQPGMERELIVSAETELVRRADLVFTTSPALAEARRQINPNTHYFPNVADYQHFSKTLRPGLRTAEDLSALRSPRILFIGALSGYKVDFQLLRYLALSRPRWSFALIGKVGEGDPWTDLRPLQGLSNLHLMGPRPYAALPAYLKGAAVAILPHTRNEYTDAMFPMKFFEYLAAGRPIVSANLPALRSFQHVARLADSREEFIAGIEEALAGRAAELRIRLAVARAHTYEKRTAAMWRLVEAFNP